jgi:hypothetical protein
MWSKRAYGRLLSLYPKDYQFRFSGEMWKAFATAAEARVSLGKTMFARFLVSEVLGLLRGVAVEWVDKWTTDTSDRSKHLPDLRMMHLPWVPREARRQSLRSRECLQDILR